jgi:hypothetical protein
VICPNCNKRTGTVKYSEGGSALDFIHGFYDFWCEECVLTKQIAFAEERAAALPDLRRRLAAVAAGSSPASSGRTG